MQHGEADLKERLVNFRIFGKGDKIKEIDECLDEAGKVQETRTYYLDSKQVVVVYGSDEKQAQIFSLKKGLNYGLFNCPAFFEYSFLRINVGYSGVPALLPTDLATKGKWENAIRSLHADAAEKNGIIRATMSDSEGSCSVDLLTSSESNSGYQVGSVSLFNKDKSLSRKIEVLDFLHDPTLGDIGGKFKMGIFGISNETGPGVTWNFTIKDIQLNVQLMISQLALRQIEQVHQGEFLDTRVLIMEMGINISVRNLNRTFFYSRSTF